MLLQLLVSEDLLAEERVMNLGLLGLLVESDLDCLALQADLVNSPHDSEELHVHAQDLLLRLEAVDELVDPHVDVQVVVVVATAHDHDQREDLALVLIDLIVAV